jgi:hypothetical protein
MLAARALLAFWLRTEQARGWRMLVPREALYLLMVGVVGIAAIVSMLLHVALGG